MAYYERNLIAQRTELSWQGRVEKRESWQMEFQHSVLTKCVFCREYPAKERESRLAVEMQIMICRYGVEINRDCERNRY